MSLWRKNDWPNLKSECFDFLKSIDLERIRKRDTLTGWPIDYILGIWLEREFNFNRKLGVDWHLLHIYADEYLKSV